MSTQEQDRNLLEEAVSALDDAMEKYYLEHRYLSKVDMVKIVFDVIGIDYSKWLQKNPDETR